eukprot:TRINITY_DN11169_c0_g1_i1.p2 TRINITY_DN11169_c0_g1~~TRINITY_DN11169_c0_g1_i1.p2  ORF type:complete len:363 (+),score=144.24 TRINITY_DN11169_c0_g1_i1:66-1154(+)
MRAAALLLAAGAAADVWEPLRELIDGNPLIANVAVTVGNSSGRLFTHEKGSTTMATEMGIASATKWIAGAAIVAVVADGKLSLDDAASKHLPYWTADPADRRSAVTLRHLLAFNSGYTGGASCGSRSFMECAQHMYETLQCSHDPGTHFDYNSIHLQFAGAMAVAASGVDMADIVEERVFKPAGMDSSTWPNRANPGLSGSLRTTPEDYDRFLHSYFTGKLLPLQLRQAMETDQYPDASFGGYALFMGHYGLANWFECLLFLGSWRQGCDASSVHTSPGMSGYYPVTDRHLDYYFQIAFPGLPILGPAESAVMRMEIKPTIDAIMTGQTPPRRRWTGEERDAAVLNAVTHFAALFNSSADVL